MKYLFTLLLLLGVIGSSIGQCTYVLDMNDSFGDGWNGASLDVSINGTFFNNYTLASGSSGSFTFPANNGDVVSFTFNSGIFDTEISYSILRGGSVLFSDGDPSTFTPPNTGLVFTHTCGGCDPVGIITASNVTTADADISWTNSASGSTSWLIEYGFTGFLPGTGTVVAASTNPATLNGLTAGRTYDVYVYNICSTGDTSFASGPSTFSTACNALSVFPYQEGFNSNSSTQNCWTVLDQNGDGDAWDMDYAFNPFEGDEVAIIRTDFNNGNNSDFLISPQIILTGRERLRFKHRCNSTFEPNDYRVVLSTTGRDASDFTNILLTDTSDAIVYEEVLVNLTAFTGPAYIAFEIPQGGLDGWILYIDDVIFERPTQNDAGVSALVSPAPPAGSGFAPVEVEVTNYGLQPLNSFTIEWAIDGIPQTAVPYMGNPLANGETAIVNLGNLNIPPSALNMSFWTTMPNGVMDEETNNDTLNVTLCPGLAGVYTVGHPTADFPTVADAFEALENCGVAAAVTLEFQPATYTGPWKIGRIPGANAVNTVTFDGLDRAMTTLTHNSLTEGAATVTFDGAQYITIKNFTIENTGTTTAYGVLFTNAANYNTVDNNAINMVVGTAANVVGVLASASLTQSSGIQTEGNNANWNVISNNDISGGNTSILFEGGERDSLNMGNKFINNELHDADDFGIYVDEQDSLVIEGNLIYDLNAGGSDAMLLYDIPNASITKNEIRGSGDYGIAIFGTFNDPTSGVFVANNLVEAGDEALYLSQVISSEVYHNTLSGNRTVYLVSQQNINFRNNIMTTTSGTCFYTTSNVSMSAMDYNLYYITGSGDAVRFGNLTYPTLAAWQTTGAAGYDANSVSGNPNFINGLRIGGALAVDAGDPSISLSEDVDGDMRPMGAAPDIGADEFMLIANDAMALSLVSPEGCGNAAADVIVEIANMGSNPLVNAPVTVNITGATNSAFTATLPVAAPGSSAQLTVGTLNTTAGGTYNFEIIVSSAADGNRANDTLRTTLVINPDNQNALTFAGDNIVCAGNTALVDATASYSPATIVWYDAPTGGNVINIGGRFTTMPLAATTTYYAVVQGCNAARAARTITVDNIGIDVDLGPDLTACGGAITTITPTITNSTATRIQWQDGALTATYNASASGDYYATVTNANGCTDTDTVNVSLSPMPTVADATTDVSCGNAADGAIDLTVTGGTGPFSYAWSNNATTEDITGLDGGFYVVTLTDNGTASNCTYVMTYQVTEPTALTANVDNTTIDCDGNGGDIDITVSGGTPGYTYVWSTGDLTQDITGAPAGAQTVTITDANGCNTTATTTVVAATPIVITIDTIRPEILSTQGGIEISVTGGSDSTNLRYTWNTGATSQDLLGLVAGTYDVTVTDITTGCQQVLTGIVVPYQLPNSIDQLSNVSNLELYPNPTTGMVWVNLDLSQTTTVQLSVMSIAGQEVQTFEPNEQLQQNYAIDLSNYPAGVYLARFIVGQEVQTVKIIVE